MCAWSASGQNMDKLVVSVRDSVGTRCQATLHELPCRRSPVIQSFVIGYRALLLCAIQSANSGSDTVPAATPSMVSMASTCAALRR